MRSRFRYEDDRIEYLDRRFHEARETPEAERIQRYLDLVSDFDESQEI
jgi:hypothetical protein